MYKIDVPLISLSLTSVDISLTKVAFVILCVIWYHLYNIKIEKNTHGGLILLSKVAD